MEKVEAWERNRLLGTAIIPVVSTGDLTGKDAKKIRQIYTQLSKGPSLIPPAVGFLFDREGRSQKEQEDLTRESGGMVAFTRKRMYENYLLNPDALASVMNSIQGFRERPVDPKEIRLWFETKGRDAKFEGNSADSEEWKINVHAAKLLESLFSEISETRVSFAKTEHSVALTEWIIENAAEDLKELSDIAGRLLDKAERCKGSEPYPSGRK
jgi:hypothetical protein